MAQIKLGAGSLNYGARCLRAARLAGKAEIPAFVDKTADSFDQIIWFGSKTPVRLHAGRCDEAMKAALRHP